LSYASLALFARIQTAIYLLFLVRVEHFSATLIAFVYALSALVAVATAVLAGGLTERFGVGRVVVMGHTAIVVGGVLLSTVAGSEVQAAGAMLSAELFFASGMSLSGVATRTLLQTRTETVMRGRVIGASQVLTGLMIAIAGAVGGGVGTAVGLRCTLIVGAVGMAGSLALVARRSLWSLA
jgi:MFS family permease